MASIDKRVRDGDARWYVRFGDPGGSQRVKGFDRASLISRGVSVVAASGWLGHSGLEITYGVYACLKPDDELGGREATAKTMRQVISQGYPMCTETALDGL